MKMKKLGKRLLSLMLCLTLLLAYLPAGLLTVGGAEAPLEVISGSKKADPSTINWENFFGPDKMDTEYAGGVWTDKSVFTGESSELPGVTMNDSGNFLVALSAIASNLSITGHTSAPTDTMLVLDLSGSMVDDTYEVGTIRRGNNNYQTVEGIDMSLIDAMIEATNSTIDTLMQQNTNNRVGVVLYSGNTSTNQAATASSATVVLPLGRYAGVDGEYLSVDTTYTTSTLYTYRGSGWNGRWEESGEATYVAEGTAVNVSVKNGLKTEAGANVNDNSKQVVGGTYIQNGLYKAMNEFLSVSDTVVPEGKAQAGAERMPVIVLMTDGAPTIATTSYNNIENSNTGDGSSTNDRITFLTQLTAAYVRGRVAAKYQENQDDEKDILFLTLGLGTENSSAATNTLYPAGSNDTLVGYWNTYLAGTAGSNVRVITGNNGLTVYRDAAVEAMNYVDTYYYASNAQTLVDSFKKIVSEIELKAESYATLVEGSNADLSGYVTFEDELGEMMYVADMKGVLMSDGNGGTVLYTGKGIAEGMTNGNLGSVDNPTERGDELVRTVKERIPGTTTTQAQQLIANAYADQQLYYADDNNWSNYIGWYADADGNYVGFWDKDSGYDNFPADAVYINKSYGYLGVNGDSDMMHVVVLVRTEIATQHQTVFFKIPASLLPTVQYKVTLNEEDPDVVEAFTREDAAPMQLVFEVGLRPDINSVNLEQKIAEHIQKGGHIHRNDDGTVTFYTNTWDIGNDKNGNGIPDADELDSAVVAESHFHPAADNSRYYYTDYTPVLDANGSPVTGASRPTDTCYHYRYYYTQSQRVGKLVPISANTMANKAQYDQEADQWYIPAGTMYQELTLFKTDKTENVTGTLSYSDFPAVFENGSKQDAYAFLGNNGSITVAPAQGIALTKTIGEISDKDGAPTQFTFTVTLSQAVANPAITDTDGNPLTGIATVDGNQITVTLSADQTVVISGIPTGTTYTVTEQESEYYSASSTNASGTVAAYTIHAVDFINNAKGYGSLVVSKDVNYPEGFAPGTAHNSKEFTIYVAFTGDITGIVAPEGAALDGNTFTLSLKDGQSATFSNIPEGVTYTVSETDELPAGYSFQEIRFSDENKTVGSKETDEAHVINSYNFDSVYPNVKLQGEKTLVTNESSWNGESFTVELLRIDHFSDEEPVSTGLTATMTESGPSYEIDMSSIQFTAPGTYYFRVVEQIPENRNENIAYDRTYGLFSITVGDGDADGKLEIQDVNAYQSTSVSGSNENGWTVQKDFTNVVSTDRVYLDIQKQVLDAATGEPVNAHLGDITFGLFTVMNNSAAPKYYALTNTQGEATLMLPVSKEDITSTANNRIVYFMREIAPAVENRVVGMNYDESWIYAIEITWNDETNQAVVKYAPIENDVIGTYALYEESLALEHTNTYESNVSVDIDLTGSKTLNGGNDLGGRSFSFTLYESTAAFVKGDTIQTVSNNGNSISFTDVTFTAPGVYYMVAQEDATNLGGITVDATEYHITVEVEKYSDANGTTRLRITDGYPVVVPYGTADDVGADGLNFNNTYTVSGFGEVAIGGKKELNGRALVAEEFEIGLYSDADCQNLIESVKNRADGTFSFSAITYTVADLGEGYTDQTFTYYIKEIPGSKGGVTYDDNTYTVTVTVSHENGELTVTPSDNATTLKISNTYEAKPVGVTLNGKKELSGDWTSVLDQSFTFQLFRADSGFAIANTEPVLTKTVTGAESFSMTLSYNDGEEGSYYYVLKEDTSANAGGVGYDAGEYHITVNVSDPGDGQLVALTTMYRPGAGNGTVATFTNTYTVEPTSITLEGSKAYFNSTTLEDLDMEEGMFSFLILEGEDLAATGYNLADGTIVFEPIRYTSAGVHTYSVIEATGDIGYIHYDETVFTVTVTVTDNGDGTLTATADYGETPIAFKNTYNHDAAQVTINGEKQLTGDWSAVPAASKQFTFELYETGSDFAISGEPAATVTSGEGNFTFGTKAFAEAGTYYYVIKELAGEADKGITYSDTEIQITVKVEDNGVGKLIPTVTTSFSSATVTAENNLVTVDGLIFINDYQADPAQYAPRAQKSYEGDEMKEFDFVLTVDGNQEQTKQNDEEGKVLFDTLYFYAPGTYQVTIQEQENAAWGLIKWDTNVYTITLYVEDNGAGQLFVNDEKTEIVSEKGTDDLVFRNVHHDIITDKDVYLLTEPAVSIDGMTVEKGEILVYEITYTNYDRIPVDVTITDTIPAHTTYVDGSADFDGVYDDGKLTWSFTDIAPDTSVTVSFQVKVTDANATVQNQAVIWEGTNEYVTREVSNPVKEDTVIKDVFHTSDPTVSIDGKKVKVGDTLLYTITYTNADQFPASVTLFDKIPEHTAYVENSADNGGVYADGALTWNVELDAGESVTVSFQVKVTDKNADIENQAHSYDGKNQLDSNTVSNYTPSGSTPETGDDSAVFLWLVLMLIGAMGIVTTLTWKKRIQ